MITNQHISNFSSTYVTFQEPKICPICFHAIEPKFLYNRLHIEELQEVYEGPLLFSAFFECPSCKSGFLSTYEIILEDETSSGSYFFKEHKLCYSAPSIPNHTLFDTKISTLSSNFVETYHQSQSAEVYNLNQIAGMGYRKALEFLIKDYCVYKNSSDCDKIYNMLLAQCINTYIDDSKIKNLAKVSIWLGNDETHYIKKFEDKDINDLKRFIDTTVYFILYNLNADEANNIVNSQ